MPAPSSTASSAASRFARVARGRLILNSRLHAALPSTGTGAESAGSEFGDEWDDLWSHLCHQGTVYTASYAAIPALAAMCLRREPSGYVAPLQLIGSILASHDAPADADQLRQRYAADLDDDRADQRPKRDPCADEGNVGHVGHLVGDTQMPGGSGDVLRSTDEGQDVAAVDLGVWQDRDVGRRRAARDLA